MAKRHANRGVGGGGGGGGRRKNRRKAAARDAAQLNEFGSNNEQNDVVKFDGHSEDVSWWQDMVGQDMNVNPLVSDDAWGPGLAAAPTVAADGDVTRIQPIADPLLDAWERVQPELGESAPSLKQDEAADLIKPHLGIDVSGYEIHLDRSAWRVAEDYCANAVVVNGRLYISRSIESMIIDILWPPVIISATPTGIEPGADMGPAELTRPGGLVDVKWRAPFLKFGDSAVVMTPGGYTVEAKGHEVLIYDDTGDCITRIWGDPHIDEGGDGGDEWHFGEDSTFILPDGAKICLDTEPNSVGEWYTVGGNVVCGADRFSWGTQGDSMSEGMTDDALEWDLANADRSEDESAGIFALQADGQSWAVQREDGKFYDVADESWSTYLGDRDIDSHGGAVELTDAQMAVAGDRDLKAAQAKGGGGGAGGVGLDVTIYESSSDTIQIPAGALQRVNPRADYLEAWQVNTIMMDLGASKESENPESKALEVEDAIGMDLSGYEIHDDFVADRIARNAVSDVAIIGGIAHVAMDIESRTVNMEIPAVIGGESGADPSLLEPRSGFLMELFFKPSFCKHSDSVVVLTHGGYTVEAKGNEVIFYDETGAQISRIWGDPHVDDNGDGAWDWHFGEDSTFILPDGAKVCLDTEPNSVGEWYTVGGNVLAGSDRFSWGTQGSGTKNDAMEWDAANADRSEDESAGVFAMAPDGQWAFQGPDGHFYDVQDESWEKYRNGDRDIDFDPSKRVEGITDEQRQVANDADIKAQQAAAEQQAQSQNFLMALCGGITLTRQSAIWAMLENNAEPRDFLAERRPGGLLELTGTARPSFLKHTDSGAVLTAGGYVVEMKGNETRIYDPDGKIVTRIWGDPHIDEGGDGKDEWHFGEDSSFILPDGTKCCLDTEPNSAGEWYTVGMDIIGGIDRYHYGVGDAQGMYDDGIAWDAAHADRSSDESAGVFAMQANGQWAIQGADGNFYDVLNESWSKYKGDRDIEFDQSRLAEGITKAQMAVASDRDLKAAEKAGGNGVIKQQNEDRLGDILAIGTGTRIEAELDVVVRKASMDRDVKHWFIDFANLATPKDWKTLLKGAVKN